MIARCLYRLLPVLLAVLFSSQLAFHGDKFPRFDYLAYSETATVAFSESEQNESQDIGMAVLAYGIAAVLPSERIRSKIGRYRQGIPLELRATGPPTV